MAGSMRSSSRLSILVGLAWFVLALAPAAFAREAGAPVRLVAPRAGAALAAGSTAELEWAPLEAFAGLPEVEEWEAFLSLDGGATYPVRITPHLDQDLRRIHWLVPSFPTADARILLRFGDERREIAVELPQRFSIVPSVEKTFLLARSALAPGEPAFPGRAGVVAWVEGSRRGGSLRQVVAAEGPGLRARLQPPASHPAAAVLEAEQEPLQSPNSLPGNGTAAALPGSRRAALSPSGSGPFLSSDILLLIQRQNE